MDTDSKVPAPYVALTPVKVTRVDIDPELARVRAHPEYQVMLKNLSDTQARCGVLLNALRDVKTGIMRRYTFEELLQLVEKGLNPPPV